jgi:hypothetical protein
MTKKPTPCFECEADMVETPATDPEVPTLVAVRICPKCGEQERIHKVQGRLLLEFDTKD